MLLVSLVVEVEDPSFDEVAVTGPVVDLLPFPVVVTGSWVDSLFASEVALVADLAVVVAV